MWLYFLLAAVSLLYVYLKWNYNHWKRLGVPNPDPTFLVGNIGATLSLKTPMGILCKNWYNQFNNVPYFGYYKMLTPGIVLRDPDLIKDVLVSEYTSFAKNEMAFNEKQDTILANNPFVLTGEKWKRSRSLLVPLLSPAKIKILFPVMSIAADRMVNYLSEFKPGKDIEAKSLSAKFSTENIVKIGYSMDANCFVDSKCEFRTMGRSIFSPSLLTGLKFTMMMTCPLIIENFPIKFMSEKFEKWFLGMISSNLESRKGIDVPYDDLLKMLKDLQKKHGLEDREVLGHSLSFFIEGFETSSTVMSFILYELARHPEIQDRVRQEMIDILKAHNGELTYDAVQEMKYLDRVVQESGRINAAAMVMSKLCTKAFELPKLPGQIEPTIIQPGTPVQIPITALHTDPNYYPDPDRFDPDRFTEEEIQNRHKMVYLPFGEGPRMCMGMRFALAQIKVGVIAVVQNFKFSLSPNHQPFVVDPRAIILQPKDGLLLNFVKI